MTAPIANLLTPAKIADNDPYRCKTWMVSVQMRSTEQRPVVTMMESAGSGAMSETVLLSADLDEAIVFNSHISARSMSIRKTNAGLLAD